MIVDDQQADPVDSTESLGGDSRRGVWGDQLGETLIELLMTVAIMSVAFVSIIGAIYSAIVQTRIHHDQTDVLAALTTAAEVVKDTSYTACASLDPSGQGSASSNYTDAISDYFNEFPLAQGDVGVPTVVSVVADTSGATTCPTNTFDLELVTLTVSSNDGHVTYSLQVVKGDR